MYVCCHQAEHRTRRPGQRTQADGCLPLFFLLSVFRFIVCVCFDQDSGHRLMVGCLPSSFFLLLSSLRFIVCFVASLLLLHSFVRSNEMMTLTAHSVIFKIPFVGIQRRTNTHIQHCTYIQDNIHNHCAAHTRSATQCTHPYIPHHLFLPEGTMTIASSTFTGEYPYSGMTCKTRSIPGNGTILLSSDYCACPITGRCTLLRGQRQMFL